MRGPPRMRAPRKPNGTPELYPLEPRQAVQGLEHCPIGVGLLCGHHEVLGDPNRVEAQLLRGGAIFGRGSGIMDPARGVEARVMWDMPLGRLLRQEWFDDVSRKYSRSVPKRTKSVLTATVSLSLGARERPRLRSTAVMGSRAFEVHVKPWLSPTLSTAAHLSTGFPASIREWFRRRKCGL